MQGDLGTPAHAAAGGHHRLGPLGLLRRGAPPGAGRPRGADRHVRPPADPVRARARRRGAGPPEDQVGDAGLRQDRRPSGVPLLRQRGAGPRHHPRGPVGATTTRSSTRSARRTRPAHGDPARAPARQPLGDRVRGLVQRPPGLPHLELRPGRPRAPRWSATATWPWTWRGSWPARATVLGADRHRRARPATPWRRTGIREIHVARPTRPGPGGLHQQGAAASSASCRASTWSSTRPTSGSTPSAPPRGAQPQPHP